MPISIPKSLLVSQHCKYLLKSLGWHPGSSQHFSSLPYTKLLQLIDFPFPASHSYTTLPFWSWTLLVVLVLSLLLTPFIGLFLPTLPFLPLWFPLFLSFMAWFILLVMFSLQLSLCAMDFYWYLWLRSLSYIYISSKNLLFNQTLEWSCSPFILTPWRTGDRRKWEAAGVLITRRIWHGRETQIMSYALAVLRKGWTPLG